MLFPTSLLWDQVFVCHPLESSRSSFMFRGSVSSLSASAVGRCLFVSPLRLPVRSSSFYVAAQVVVQCFIDRSRGVPVVHFHSVTIRLLHRFVSSHIRSAYHSITPHRRVFEH